MAKDSGENRYFVSPQTPFSLPKVVFHECPDRQKRYVLVQQVIHVKKHLTSPRVFRYKNPNPRSVFHSTTFPKGLPYRLLPDTIIGIVVRHIHAPKNF